MKNKIVVILAIISAAIIIGVISILSITKNNKNDIIFQKEILDTELQYLDYQMSKIYAQFYEKEPEQVDWEQLYTEITSLYIAWNSAVIHFTNLNINTVYLTDFGRALDHFTVAVNKKNFSEASQLITDAYGFLPQFAEGYTGNTILKNKLYTKYYLQKAYTLLYTDDWNSISENMNQAIAIFYKNISSVENYQGKELLMNKIYISLNELKNTIDQKDKNLFNLKYQIVLDQLNHLT